MKIYSEEKNILIKYGIDPDQLKGVSSFQFKAGEYFIWEGHPLDHLYFVVKGKAKVCLSASNGKQLLLCYFISQGIIGDIELMTEQKQAFTTMQAVTPFLCIGVPMELNRQILKNNLAFMNLIGKELAFKLKESDTRGVVQGLYTLEERLCAYIMQMQEEGWFRETLTEVAAFLGTSYRHLLRGLEKLCKEGILIKSGRGYQIVNPLILETKGEKIYQINKELFD